MKTSVIIKFLSFFILGAVIGWCVFIWIEGKQFYSKYSTNEKILSKIIFANNEKIKSFRSDLKLNTDTEIMPTLKKYFGDEYQIHFSGDPKNKYDIVIEYKKSHNYLFLINSDRENIYIDKRIDLEKKNWTGFE